MTVDFEVRRQQWLREVKERLDYAIATGRTPTRLKTRRVVRPPAPPPPVSIVTQYQRLRALAGEITPAQAGLLFALSTG